MGLRQHNANTMTALRSMRQRGFYSLLCWHASTGWFLAMLLGAWFAWGAVAHAQVLPSSSSSAKASLLSEMISGSADEAADNRISSFRSVGDKAVVETPRVRAELVVQAADGIAPGRSVWVGLLLQHAPGWHTYWKNPGDSGLPTQLDWQLPQGWQAGEIDWPSPAKYRIGDLANYGYENQVLLPVPITITEQANASTENTGLLTRTGDTATLSLNATWLVCKLECIPEQGHFEVQVPLAVSTGLHAHAFEQAWHRRPQNLSASGSYMRAQDGRLEVRLEGLPAFLHGTPLELFIESPHVQAHGARNDKEWHQRWEGASWIANMPFSADRQASASVQALVVTRLSESEGGDWNPDRAIDLTQPTAWRVEVPVTKPWEGIARIEPSNALLQALAENQTPANARTRAGSNESNQAATASTAAPVLVADWEWGQWFGWLGLALLGGALLNLMPCVFPVLAIKALSIARYSHQPHLQKRDALAYGVGVLLSFLLMGAIVLALRLLGTHLGWGFQLQSPWFVAALALLFAWMGLSLAGVISAGIWMPASWRSAQPQQSLAGAFFSGVLAVLVASPCTGPFMGAALGATLSLPAPLALAIFAALGLGMALPLVLLVWFPSFLARLPKPGAWMETFRTAMAFPMFATVVWLLWVLAQQVGIHGSTVWLFVLWAVGFAAWLWGKRPGWGRGKVLPVIWLLVLAVPLMVIAWGLQYFVSAVHRADTAPLNVSTPASQGTSWQAWEPAVQEQLLAKQQPLFVDYTASWCITCQYNKMTTLADADVMAAFVQADVALLRADWTRQNPDITQSLHTLGRTGVPTYALYLPGEPVQVMTEILDKQDLLKRLQASQQR